MEKLMRRDLEFKKAISQAELEANQKVENALFEAAMSGNVTAIQVWLYNRMPTDGAIDEDSSMLGPIKIHQ
jgi:hypothetical protein